MEDYLMLLSLCQTCRYKGVSFFRFLLSRERDIDEFANGKRRTKRLPAVEVYPKGYIPPVDKSFRNPKAATKTSEAASDLHVESD